MRDRARPSWVKSPSMSPFLFFFKLINLFLAVLGLHCFEQALSSCGEWGLLFAVVHRFLIVVASLVAECGL